MCHVIARSNVGGRDLFHQGSLLNGAVVTAVATNDSESEYRTTLHLLDNRGFSHIIELVQDSYKLPINAGPLANWSISVTCIGICHIPDDGIKPCGSCMTIQESDIGIMHLKQPSGGAVQFGFKCPTCGAITIIPHAMVPDDIKETARRRRLTVGE